MNVRATHMGHNKSLSLLMENNERIALKTMNKYFTATKIGLLIISVRF